MSALIDEKGWEKRAYLMWHRDGLADLVLGGLVLLFGIGMKYDQVYLAPMYGCVGYPIWLMLKKGITERRLGYVEFSSSRKQKLKRGWIILFILGCMTFIAGILAYYAIIQGYSVGEVFQQHGYLSLGLIFGILISSIGLLMQLARLHLYSLLILGAVVIVHLLGMPMENGIIAPGIVIVISGLFMLVRFMRQYPVHKVESDAGQME